MSIEPSAANRTEVGPDEAVAVGPLRVITPNLFSTSYATKFQQFTVPSSTRGRKVAVASVFDERVFPGIERRELSSETPPETPNDPFPGSF